MASAACLLDLEESELAGAATGERVGVGARLEWVKE